MCACERLNIECVSNGPLAAFKINLFGIAVSAQSSRSEITDDTAALMVGRGQGGREQRSPESETDFGRPHPTTYTQLHSTENGGGKDWVLAERKQLNRGT